MLGYSFTWLNGAALGSWEINPVVGAMPQKVATAFGELAEKLVGASYEPIAYVGKQQVNGINHAVVALQTIVSKDPHKNVVLMKFNEKGMDCTLESIEPLVQEGGVFGGYAINPQTDIDVDSIKAFKDVTDGWVGANITLVAQLATKVVKGINITFLATVTPVYPNAVTTLKLVTVNSLTKTIDFADVL